MNVKVILHGLYMAVGGAVVAALAQLIQNGTLPTTGKDWSKLGMIALGAALVYFTKLFHIGSSADTTAQPQ